MTPIKPTEKHPESEADFYLKKKKDQNGISETNFVVTYQTIYDDIRISEIEEEKDGLCHSQPNEICK